MSVKLHCQQSYYFDYKRGV